MRKSMAILLCALGLAACDKHDPILPGVRTAIFDSAQVRVLNKTISDIPESALHHDNAECKYTQDASNVVWDGDRKIFSGFPTDNTVAGTRTPICDGGYVYAGLTTGEVVKINPRNRQIVWIADVYRASNLTGGSSMVDIVAPIVPVGNAVYAGGLGDAFCKINAKSGATQWCVEIGVAVPFQIAGDYALVVATDDYLYAIETKTGDVFWRTAVENQVDPNYADGVITVGKTQINVADGKIIK